MNAPHVIFFDAVGTLIHPEPAAPLVYAAAARRFGSRYTSEVIAHRFTAAFQRQEALDRAGGWLTSEERELKRWRAIVGEVLDDVADPDGCFTFLFEHFARPVSWRCEPEAEALVDDLCGRGFRLGLASNFDARLHAVSQGLPPLRPLLDNVVVSYKIGYRKPARAFFDAMCQRTGAQPADIVHVGDDPGNDCAGAEAAGMTAVLFDPSDRHGNWEGARIRTLEGLLKVLHV